MKTTKKAASAKPAAAAKKAPAAKPVAKPVAKPAEKPVAAAKKAPVAKPAAKPAAPAPAKKAVEPEVRYRMIQVAAYYEAQKNGFVGDSTYFWTVAEKQIDDMLGL
ncbi:MAG: DUF2934 domain-containing protein [Kiritimatiellae bacterium]|nr:DUF2934 domain-containing protein [Kiritimatiellia bacterium]